MAQKILQNGADSHYYKYGQERLQIEAVNLLQNKGIVIIKGLIQSEAAIIKLDNYYNIGQYIISKTSGIWQQNLMPAFSNGVMVYLQLNLAYEVFAESDILYGFWYSKCVHGNLLWIYGLFLWS